MSQCLNPECLQVNPENTQFCQQCGSNLLLVDRYRAVRILGKGGFGRTFLAIDEFKPSKPPCVIKQFLPDIKSKKGLKKAAELFEREAMRLDELGKHSQIPELLAFFNQEDRQYLIQEFIDGDDLAKELKIKGVFNEQQIRELLNDMLAVLKFVHSNNVIHRDIKPENIIRRKQDGKLVLVDFGAAKSAECIESSVTGTIIGSAAYIAPEQAVGKPKFASDLYSLGATCLHLLTDVQPTELFDVAEGEWKWREYLEDNDISYELSRVLDKLVEGATKRRFEKVEEVLQALYGGISPVVTNRRTSSSNYAQKPKYGVSTNSSSKTSASVKSRVKPPSVKNLNLKVFTYTFLKIDQTNDLVIGRNPPLKTIEYAGKAKYITVDLGKGITMDLVGIPGGKYLMGSPDNEAERSSEESPQHPVAIPPFLMGKYPVTQQQWERVMKSNPSRFTDHPDNPVEKVSWFDCWEFCEKLSEKIGREFRLPTEAEWEYACRGKTTTPFHFGETIADELANYNGEYAYASGKEGEYRGKTTKVGSFPPNSFGLYDLHGNVAEWCADSWHDSYQNAPNNGSAWLSENEKDSRVLRGGSWLHLAGCCRSSHRLSSPPGSKSDAFGFRIASSV
ncbi:MAG: bifunctional serine/threonine-protein kinase/formylglycine-generating enzyme family protein [Xenococcaceae cyanobacterium MO_207.B15]|nr:bifunctional serine/threonine-protein kinase/formylglycine-generating enzyme family protein [Xenococcaceae cyanobacterium MO_207.B15]MDJ0742058.1 bifunctional serine/threonine-protein kinase/formylglycine-generating enzyme family protein [Xenococcaceae cyanobacterium MO_167.B27]